MEPFHKFLARPFLRFCFDLSATALGAFIPTVVAAARPGETQQAVSLVLVAVFYLVLMSIFMWAGLYFLGDRYQAISRAHPDKYFKHLAPGGAAFILLMLYFSK